MAAREARRGGSATRLAAVHRALLAAGPPSGAATPAPASVASAAAALAAGVGLGLAASAA